MTTFTNAQSHANRAARDASTDPTSSAESLAKAVEALAFAASQAFRELDQKIRHLESQIQSIR